MARLLTTGAETQSGLLEGVTPNSGGFTFDTTTFRSGQVAYKCTTDVSGNGASVEFDMTPNPGHWVYARMYMLRVNTTGPNNTVLQMDSATHDIGRIEINSSNAPAAFNGTGGIPVGGAADPLASNQWYRIELGIFVPVSGTGIFKFWLDGQLIAQDFSFALGDNTGISKIRFGWVNALGGGFPNEPIWIDDIAVNDDTGTAQNTMCGSGRVWMLNAISDSARGANWTAGAGGTTNLWQAVDNAPPAGVVLASATNTSQIKNVASDATGNYDATLQTAALEGVPGTDIAVLAFGVAAIGGSSATSITMGLSSVSNPPIAEATGAVAAAAGTYPSSWSLLKTATAYGLSSGLNISTSPVLRMGKRTANTGAAMCAFMGLMVETQTVNNVSITQGQWPHAPFRLTTRKTLTEKPNIAAGNNWNDLTAALRIAFFGQPITKMTAGGQATPLLSLTGGVTFAQPGDNLQTKLAALTPGDTLLLADGVYTAPTFPNGYALRVSGVHGLPNNLTTVQALHDGQAIMDGQGKNYAVFIDDSTHVLVQGIAARYSGTTIVHDVSVVTVFGDNGGTAGRTDDIQLRRISGHDTMDDNGVLNQNAHVFQVGFGATNIIVEDCVAYGHGRYMFITYHGDGVVFRRCWAYHGGWNSTVVAPRACYSAYSARHVLFENCVGSHVFPTKAEGTKQFQTFYYTTDDNVLWPNNDVKFVGCIFYDCYNGTYLNGFSSNDPVQVPITPVLRHIVEWHITANDGQGAGFSSANSGYINDQSFVLGQDANSFLYDHITGVRADNGAHAAGGTVHATLTNSVYSQIAGNSDSDLGTEDYNDFFGNGSNPGPNTHDKAVDPAYQTATYGNGAYLMGPTAGALFGAAKDGSTMGAVGLMYQTINQVLTSAPLWPWLMEARVVTELPARSPTYDIFTTLAGAYMGTGYGSGVGTGLTLTVAVPGPYNPSGKPWAQYPNPRLRFAGSRVVLTPDRPTVYGPNQLVGAQQAAFFGNPPGSVGPLLVGESDGIGTLTNTEPLVSHQLVAESDGTATASVATVLVSHPLVAESDGVATASTATVLVSHPLVATAAGISAPTAALSISHSFVAESDGTAAASAVNTLVMSHSLVAEADGVATMTNTEPLVSHKLVAESDGVATATATLIAGGIRGSMDGVATATVNTLVMAHLLVAESDGTATGSTATVLVGHPLVAEADGTAAASVATMLVSHPLVAESDGTGTASIGSVTISHPLVAESDGTATASVAALTISHGLVGESDGVATGSIATVTISHPLVATSAGVAGAVATMATGGFVGAAPGTATATVQLTVAHPITLNADGVGGAVAVMLVSHSLVATSTGMAGANVNFTAQFRGSMDGVATAIAALAPVRVIGVATVTTVARNSATTIESVRGVATASTP